jgi:hypothetical protein
MPSAARLRIGSEALCPVGVLVSENVKECLLRENLKSRLKRGVGAAWVA